MEFIEQRYPVDKAIFDRIVAKRGTNRSEMALAMGYGRSAVNEGARQGWFSKKIAAALFNTYGITPNDYAPKVPGVNAPKETASEIGVMRFDEKGRQIRLDGTQKPEKKAPLIDAALIKDGVYTLEFVDVRKARKSESGRAEGYRFVTVASNETGRAPFYFGLFDKKPGGLEPDILGEAWIRHLLSVTMGEDYQWDSRPEDVIGRKCLAYIQIYEKGGKRYNRCTWVEAMPDVESGETEPLSWHDFVNANSGMNLLLDVLDYVVGEIGLRTREQE